MPTKRNTRRTTTRAPRARVPAGDFWTHHTIDEIIKEQGIKPMNGIDDFAGGWPADQLNDGFEVEIRKRRDAELKRRK